MDVNYLFALCPFLSNRQFCSKFFTGGHLELGDTASFERDWYIAISNDVADFAAFDPFLEFRFPSTPIFILHLLLLQPLIVLFRFELPFTTPLLTCSSPFNSQPSSSCISFVLSS